MRNRSKAVITGGTKGLGRATVERLWMKGYDIATCSRSAADLDELRSALAPTRPEQQLLTCTCDLATQEGAQAFAKTCRSWEAIDLLVNNAGQYLPGKLVEDDGTALEQLWKVNVLAVFRLTKALLPQLKAVSTVSDVINVSSIAGLDSYPNSGAYSVSKFALRGLSLVLRDELKSESVRVTTIYPGAAMSASWDGSGVDPNRIMKAEDVAKAICSVTELSPQAVVEEITLRPLLGDL